MGVAAPEYKGHPAPAAGRPDRVAQCPVDSEPGYGSSAAARAAYPESRGTPRNYKRSRPVQSADWIRPPPCAETLAAHTSSCRPLSGTVPGIGHRHRKPRRGPGHAGGLEGCELPTRACNTSASRPGVIEGEYPPVSNWEELRTAPPTSADRPTTRARPPRSSWWMAHTGTGGGIALRAGRRRDPIHPSCGVRTCCSLISYWLLPPSLSPPVLGPVHRPDQ